MELEADFTGTEPEVDTSVQSDERGEEIIEEEDYLEFAQEIEVQDDSLVFDSAFQSCSRDNHSDEKEPSEDITKNSSPSVNNQHSPNTEVTTEDVLLGFYKAFRKTNRQLKRNDVTLMQLLRQQNAIFKSQTRLLMKLISSD